MSANHTNWRGYAEELDAIEAEIEQAQQAKRDIYASVRELHGKVKADALKAAMRIRRMKPEKREQAEQVEAETEMMLAAISGQSRAPRATRAREEADTSGESRERQKPALQASKPEAPHQEPADQQPEGTAATYQPKPYVLRPNCQHPENCAGVGTQHCHACSKAIASETA